MKSTDARKATWKTWIDALEGDTRIVALERAFLTAYKTELDTGTTMEHDQRALYIHQRFFAKIIY